MRNPKVENKYNLKFSDIKNLWGGYLTMNKKEYSNVVEVVSNYATDALQEKLTKYGNYGYKLVSVTLAKNKYGVDVMYLFFTKEKST